MNAFLLQFACLFWCSFDPLTDSHKGIDHIFWNPNIQKYAIVETKYNGTNMNTLTNGTRQMSDEWFDNGLANSRLKVALGNDSLYDQVKNNYERVVAYVSPDGKFPTST